jgi:hypothetical protein
VIGLRPVAGAPSDGTTEVQTLTIGGTPTGGTFKLAYEGQITASITWSATTNTLLANIQAALRALATIGSAGITATEGSLSSGIGTVTLTFGGNLAKLVVPLITVALNSLTGTAPTLAVTEATPGVTATERGAGPGALLVDVTNKTLYQNKGTALAPVWTLVGTIGAGELTTAMLANKAVTGPKLDEAALNGLVFTGKNGAGACTLTGAKVGDKVLMLTNLTDASAGKADFESTITVADQIQQSSASNYSAKKFSVLLVVKS